MNRFLSLTCALVSIGTAPLHAQENAPATVAHSDCSDHSDLETALREAAKQKKSLFIVYGREGCNNCRTLHHWISTKKLPLPESDYLIAKLNCDDGTQREAFYARYSVESRTLPFVVVTSPTGELLASRTGYGTLPEYKSLLREATKQAAALVDKSRK